MEVDEAPRARGRFNLDCEAREHMSEGLEVWIPNDVTPFLAQPRDTTCTSPDGCGVTRIYPNLDLEWQSGERCLIAPEGARREIAAAES